MTQDETKLQLVALLKWCVGGNRTGNPYCKPPIVEALKHLRDLDGGKDWLDALNRYQSDANLEQYLSEARDGNERAELLAHATTPGDCDAEYCPWAAMKENLCIREATHRVNCRCPDCCESYDE